MERGKEMPHSFPEDKKQQKAERLFSEETSRLLSAGLTNHCSHENSHFVRRAAPNECEKKKTGAAAFLLQGIYRKLGVIVLAAAAFLVFFGGLRLGKMIYGTSLTKEKVQVTDTLLYQQDRKSVV